MECNDWQSSDDVPHVGDREVHVWRVALDVNEDVERTSRMVLSADEAARCARFKFPHLQRRYAVARATLRRLLGGVLDRDPTEIIFTYGAQDKPALADDSGVLFNVSHSEECALIAVGRCEALGVDLEFMKPGRACRQIADRFFAPEEVAVLETLSGDAYTRGFYRCWTRKEAFVKALGGGLSISLRSFAVSLDDAPRLTRLDEDSGSKDLWRFVSMTTAVDFTGCIAARGAGAVQCWTYKACE